MKINNPMDIPLFKTFVPSFFATIEPDLFRYVIYLGIDVGDQYLDNCENQLAVRIAWRDIENKQFNGSHHIPLQFFTFANTEARNAWASNYLVQIAYSRGWDYFYRVNDDSKLLTANWSAIYVETFKAMRPMPYLGTLAPKDVSYDGPTFAHNCVHRRHIEAFGFMFPYSTPNWYSDHWHNEVYSPPWAEEHSFLRNATMAVRVMSVLIHHQAVAGRYEPDYGGGSAYIHQLPMDKLLLLQYLSKQCRRGLCVNPS